MFFLEQKQCSFGNKRVVGDVRHLATELDHLHTRRGRAIGTRAGRDQKRDPKALPGCPVPVLLLKILRVEIGRVAGRGALRHGQL